APLYIFLVDAARGGFPQALASFLQNLFPVFIGLFAISVIKDDQQIQKILKLISMFIAISSIPFHIGILETMGKQYDLSGIYGYEAYGLTGVFQNPSVASLAFAFSGIIGLGAFTSSSHAARRAFWLALLFLALFSLLR